MALNLSLLANELSIVSTFFYTNIDFFIGNIRENEYKNIYL